MLLSKSAWHNPKSWFSLPNQPLFCPCQRLHHSGIRPWVRNKYVGCLPESDPEITFLEGKGGSRTEQRKRLSFNSVSAKASSNRNGMLWSWDGPLERVPFQLGWEEWVSASHWTQATSGKGHDFGPGERWIAKGCLPAVPPAAERINPSI